MKKLILILTAIFALASTSHAQQIGRVEVTGDDNYQHLFLTDDADMINTAGVFLWNMGLIIISQTCCMPAKAHHSHLRKPSKCEISFRESLQHSPSKSTQAMDNECLNPQRFWNQYKLNKINLNHNMI